MDLIILLKHCGNNFIPDASQCHQLLRVGLEAGQMKLGSYKVLEQELALLPGAFTNPWLQNRHCLTVTTWH
jgi:hypothetical protein